MIDQFVLRILPRLTLNDQKCPVSWNLRTSLFSSETSDSSEKDQNLDVQQVYFKHIRIQVTAMLVIFSSVEISEEVCLGRIEFRSHRADL